MPFVGTSGRELVRMLEQAGIDPTLVRFTNVVNERPKDNKIENWFLTSKKKATEAGVYASVFSRFPRQIILDGIDELRREISQTGPELIIALGNTALWALTGKWGITKWRGSLMNVNGPVGQYPITVVPTYHPAAILRQWSWRNIALHDLRYATNQIPAPIPEPDWAFILRPNFTTAVDHLTWMLQCAETREVDLAADLETRSGQIACVGLATSADSAICIPFLSVENPEGFWSVDEETELVLLCRRVLTHPRIHVVWQNGAYDLQYIFRCWHFIANVSDDTMLMQHAAFPGALPKGLDFLASMYCQYRYYWKDEGKEWDPKTTPEDALWRYNCLDACRTFEIAPVLRETLAKLNLTHVYDHSMSLYEPTLFMMLNGVRIDRVERLAQTRELIETMNEVQAWIDHVICEPFNVKSPTQMRKLFYDQIGLPVILHRQTRKPTLNEDALKKISSKHPILSPLTDRIAALRSAGVFVGTFLKAAVDRDDRMRCQYHIAGTETGRFSSTQNAFGGGTNLENIPRPRDQNDQTPLVRFPSIRRIFIPDQGTVIADFDLDRADAHIVAWEAGAEGLKELFRQKVDIHLANAITLNQKPMPPLEHLRETAPEYPGIKKQWTLERQFAKNFCHGSNYGGKEKAVHAAVSQVYGLTGITIQQVRYAQSIWFTAHPEILEWHNRVEHELMTTRKITTILGRTRFYFDRIDPSIVNQALAYLGQSPVADVINKGLRRIYTELPWCQLLLQNHDSIVVQFPNDNTAERAEEIRSRLLVPLPYKDELTIPVGYKVSDVSWGDVR